MSDLRWAPPTMQNPTIIDLSKTDGKVFWQFGPNEDVLFIASEETRTLPKLQTDGGRNIQVVGGHYAPEGGDGTGTLAFRNVHGSVWVEGVHIDNKNAFARDGILVAGASGKAPDVYVQNSLIENMNSTRASVHADVFQTQGPVGDLHFYNVTGSTNYQGFFIAPQHATGSAHFENVNMRYIPGGDAVSYQYWFLDSADQQPFPVTLKNVHATERAGQNAEEYSVWPKVSMSSDMASVRDGNKISWPDLPYDGHITVGGPTGGDFAKASQVGINYKSPGTVDASGDAAAAEAAAMAGDEQQPDQANDSADDMPADLPESGAPTTWIRGTMRDDTLHGTDGNDYINGGRGKDTAIGGKGDDYYVINQSDDVIIENPGEGIDTVETWADYRLPANVENLNMGRSGIVHGNELDNIINGSKGDDVIHAVDGDNVITGGAGADTLYSGAGADTFVYTSIDDKGDVIKNFEVGSDMLDLRPLMSSVNAKAGGDYVSLVQQGNDTLVKVDVTGTGQAGDTLATIEGVDASDLTDYVDHWLGVA
ncbi:calcium-binding protein [Telmatospirillum sp. J64-1]|uniref:calcium-binding protein n=1 Tax=Telmatospirillum sp. J64-1 TaxID=2502183 RepID=UPI00115E7426|nr:calcium-binding protein [Telmatospirillum sp. J64-1]